MKTDSKVAICINKTSNAAKATAKAAGKAALVTLYGAGLFCKGYSQSMAAAPRYVYTAPVQPVQYQQHDYAADFRNQTNAMQQQQSLQNIDQSLQSINSKLRY